MLAELNDLLGTLDQARLAAQYSPEGRIRVDRTLAEVTPGQAFEAAWHGVSLVEPGPTLHVTRSLDVTRLEPAQPPTEPWRPNGAAAQQYTAMVRRPSTATGRPRRCDGW